MKEIYEAWSDDDGTTFATMEGIKKQKEKGLLSENAKFLYAIEAENYEEAITAHHIKMGWDPYKSIEDH